IWAMPEEYGWQAAAVTGIVLLLHVWLHLGLGLKLLRQLKLLTPPDARLQRIVAETSARMCIPVRNVWMYGGPSAQAFALYVTYELIFTQRLMEICNDEEVSAICA